MGTMNARNGMDLIEAESIKKTLKELYKNYTKKILMTQIAIML